MEKRYLAFRLQAGEGPNDPPDWLPHTEWCETPSPLREPLTRDGALNIIDWSRQRGDRYCIRPVCDDRDMQS